MAKDSDKYESQKVEVILQAARKIFRQKGYDASTLRDIANEAKVNHALINYYFRNKHNLLQFVLRDDLYTHLEWLATVVNDSSKNWEEKIQTIVDFYTEFLVRDPDSQRFFFNEIGMDDDFLTNDTRLGKMVRGSLLERELLDMGLSAEDCVNLVINAISLMLTPIMTAPLMKVFCSLDDQSYIYLINKRRQMILPWLKSMYGVK